MTPVSPATLAAPAEVVYPESDGKPLAENDAQLRWILHLYSNLRAQFADRQREVYVSGDMLWYPVEGNNKLRVAPDVFVVFGRPTGHRASYLQWKEEGIPLTVVFEVLSPSNTVAEMRDKLAFYDQHRVEEYYVYDPLANMLEVRVRRRGALTLVSRVGKFASPRLGIRFEMTQPEMTVYGPNGRPFVTPEESKAQQEEAARRLSRMAELGRKARRGQASAEELAELERLEDEAIGS